VPNAHEQLDQLLGSQITLGMLTDIVAYTIDLDLETKVRLLAECDVFERARMLLVAIASRPAAGPARTFPPDFSMN
jgi:ATP-dependent Lon protease